MLCFWDEILKDVPICKDLVENYSTIKDEVISFVSNPGSLFDYPKYNVGGTPLYENYWKAVPLSVFNGEFISMYANEQQKQYIDFVIKNAKQRCPTINKIISPLEESDDLANCFISRLLPGSIINPHCGWTQHYMRIHLGLVCDPKCQITVSGLHGGGETRTWEEGKLLAFRDGPPQLHSVKHEGEHERIILSVDVKISHLQKFADVPQW